MNRRVAMAVLGSLLALTLTVFALQWITSRSRKPATAGQPGSAPPVDRDRLNGGWLLAATSTVDAPDVVVSIDCEDPSDDIYLAASLRWNGGFETKFVSKNSVKAPCTSTLADPPDPVDAQPKRRATRPLRPTRKDRSR